MAVCIYCERPAIYRDREMGRCLCAAHARIEVVGSGERKKPPVEVQVRRATGGDIARVVELAQYFWGEDEFECFERNYLIRKLPAFVACAGDTVVGALNYSEEPERTVIVVINVLPQWQGIGVGRALVEALATEAKRKGIARIVVATANDDMLALTFYQRLGFRITGIKPGEVLRRHGGEITGFSGIPIRDEIQLALEL